MSVAMSGTYLGKLKLELHHHPSGNRIHSAAPVDNNGDGSSFSPTDLVAAALGSCMCTIMGIVADRDGISLEGMKFSLEKHMQSDPRRIARIPLKIEMPAGVDPSKRGKLEQAALTCPVARSLLEAIETPVEFVYPD
ncbi:MAG: OsmC family protein [Candidatus Eremiobacteraeota bacterium]|nr:OsmC family protein [Candidatus Eremiobacteraeota bacterium]